MNFTYERSSFGKKMRVLREQHTKGLVSAFFGFEEGTEEFDTAFTFASDNLDYNRYLDANDIDVRRKYASAADRLRSLAEYAMADSLEAQLRHISTLDFSFSNNSHLLTDILAFLLALHQKHEESVVRPVREVKRGEIDYMSASEREAVAELRRLREEWGEVDDDEEEMSDDSEWSDDEDSEEEKKKANTSSMQLVPTPSKYDSKEVERRGEVEMEDEIQQRLNIAPPLRLSITAADLDEIVFKPAPLSFPTAVPAIAPPPKNLEEIRELVEADGGTVGPADIFSKNSSMLVSKQAESQLPPTPIIIVDELVLLRDVLSTLIDTPGLVLKQSESEMTGVEPLAGLRTAELSTGVIGSSLQHIAEIGGKLKQIKRFSNIVLRPDSPYCSLTLCAFASAVNKWMHSMRQYVIELEDWCRGGECSKAVEKGLKRVGLGKSAPFTTLVLLEMLNPWRRRVEAVVDVIDGIAALGDSATTAHRTAHLLDLLLEGVDECSRGGDVGAGDGATDVHPLLLRVFLDSIEPYLSIIDGFVKEGVIDDVYDEFCIKTLQKSSKSPLHTWRSCFDVANANNAVPNFVQPLLSIILDCGRSKHILRYHQAGSASSEGEPALFHARSPFTRARRRKQGARQAEIGAKQTSSSSSLCFYDQFMLFLTKIGRHVQNDADKVVRTKSENGEISEAQLEHTRTPAKMMASALKADAMVKEYSPAKQLEERLGELTTTVTHRKRGVGGERREEEEEVESVNPLGIHDDERSGMQESSLALPMSPTSLSSRTHVSGDTHLKGSSNDEGEGMGKSEEASSSLLLLTVPIRLLLSQLMHPYIDEVNSKTSAELVGEMWQHHYLRDYLSIVEEFMLMKRGDVWTTFFRETRTTIKFGHSVMETICEGIQIANDEMGIDAARQVLCLPHSEWDGDESGKKGSMGATLVQTIAGLKVEWEVEPLVALVITPERVDRLAHIFRFLLTLGAAKSSSDCIPDRCDLRISITVKTSWAVVSEIRHFVISIWQYVHRNIEIKWSEFIEKMEACSSVTSMNEAFDAFLVDVERICLLQQTPSAQRVHTAIVKLAHLAETVSYLQVKVIAESNDAELGVGGDTTMSVARTRLEEAVASFKEMHRFLMNVLHAILRSSPQSQFEDIRTLLDYNDYYSNQA